MTRGELVLQRARHFVPHYESFHHVDIETAWMKAMFNDLDRVGALDDLRIAASGYLAAPEQAKTIGVWARETLQGRSVEFVLDPTLGDVEVGFITNPALAEAVRAELVPVATGMTPNLFELALLTGGELDGFLGQDSHAHRRIVNAAETLLRMSEAARWVAVTGVNFPNNDIGVILVTRNGVANHAHERRATSAKGLGDTFAAAMVVALVNSQGRDVEELEAAVRLATDAVLNRIR